jgi:hypothetical protein
LILSYPLGRCLTLRCLSLASCRARRLVVAWLHALG